MTEADRAQWIAILEAAAGHPPDVMNAEWEWLMGELRLPLEYYLAVCAAIKQGRWRTARDPRAYVKTVAKREAVKRGLVENAESELVIIRSNVVRHGADVSTAEALGQLAHILGGSEAIPGADGVYRRGDGTEDYRGREEWEHEFDSAWEYLLSKLPDDLKVNDEPSPEKKAAYDKINALGDEFHLHMRAPFSPNWKAWADRAGFDEWEQLALKCRVSRKSREKALAEQPDEPSRKALQAAWKKFDRTGMERLRNALK